MKTRRATQKTDVIMRFGISANRENPVAEGGSPRTALLIAMLILAGCNRATSPADSPGDGKIPVVVSIQPQRWLVEQVGGELVDVMVMVSPEDDPHSYQPTDAQISRAMQSTVYFRIGVPVESGPWFQALRGSGKLEVVDTRRGIELREMHGHACNHEEHDHGHHHHDHAGRDPHIWTSPRLLKIQAATVAQTLAELAPEKADEFQQNLAAVHSRLDEVDAEIRERLGPYAGRVMLVFHPAWGYFADEYGLRQVAVEIEGKEPSDAELTELQQLAREEGTRVIFVQPQVAGPAAEAVARAVGARVEVLDPLADDPPAELLRAAEVLAASCEPKGN